MRQAKPVLVGGVVAEAAIYLLTLTGVLTNWWFAILTAVVAMSLPLIGRMVKPEALRSE